MASSVKMTAAPDKVVNVVEERIVQVPGHPSGPGSGPVWWEPGRGRERGGGAGRTEGRLLPLESGFFVVVVFISGQGLDPCRRGTPQG